jgi:hypothetical protein
MNRIPGPNLPVPSAFPLVSVPLPGAGRAGDAGGAYGTSYDVGVTSGTQQGWAGNTGRLAAEHAIDLFVG